MFIDVGFIDLISGSLDSFPAGTFEFVQIQLNYLDWELQRAEEQYNIIVAHGLKVIVMEPCRGGRLASLHPDADKLLLAARPGASVASWAFRFAGSLPEVGVILSGMNRNEQATDNISTFSDFEPLSDAERTALADALSILRAKINVPCTACRYCDGCPAGLDIPALLALYNHYRIDGGSGALRRVLALPAEQRPSACIGCGACTVKCPQNIDIPAKMAEFAASVADFEASRRH